MKRAEWRAVYTPRGDMLEKRVRQTLMQLEDKPTHARPKRMVWLAAALVLVLAAAVAVAAGLTRSAKYDAKLLAHQALEEKYGFTRDMDSFFRCTVEEKAGETVVTYSADEDVGDFAWKLGDYIVTIRDGKAEASWSNDGEAVGGDFSSDVWDTALLARGIARRKAGEEWYEITGETLETGESLSGAEKTTPEVSAAGESAVQPGEGMLAEQEALDLARQALEGDGGISAEALNDPENELYAVCQKEEGKTVWNVWFHSAEGISVVTLDAADGTILDVIVDTGMAGNG
ncbi:MAG: hypothetical protein UDN39_05940 [Christensenellales bacterium]|nr:hypothetical protein [Christensenellales bacterium]